MVSMSALVHRVLRHPFSHSFIVYLAMVLWFTLTAPPTVNNEDRVRPIILTTLTTILGLLPIALKINMDFLTGHVTFSPPSSLMWYQLALSIVGGLSFAFIVTLIVTPCLLMLGSKKEKDSC
jgi:Cu/Ag efflux pump CusA